MSVVHCYPLRHLVDHELEPTSASADRPSSRRRVCAAAAVELLDEPDVKPSGAHGRRDRGSGASHGA